MAGIDLSQLASNAVASSAAGQGDASPMRNSAISGQKSGAKKQNSIDRLRTQLSGHVDRIISIEKYESYEFDEAVGRVRDDLRGTMTEEEL